jgi:hypothetical protein
MNKTQLAEALNITTRQLRSLAARGMPTESLKSAQAWRSSHLDITQCKNFRIDRNPGQTKRPAQKPEAKKPEPEFIKKAEVNGLSPDPYEPFLHNLLLNSRELLIASLMADVEMSFHDASLAFDEMCCVISDIRQKDGFDSKAWEIPSPIDSSMPAEWRAQIKAAIEERAGELELLREEQV